MIEPYYKTDNCQLYQCDNLDLLKQLPDNYIDLIYCDILYNTGRKFKDFDDKLGTPQEAVLWYEPRLIEMKRVLKNTGSIYLHMDFRLVHYLKVKMDEIFGISNFKNHLIWCYRSNGMSAKSYNKKHDDILFYTKSKSYIFNNNEIREAEIPESVLKRYGKEIDEKGYYTVPTQNKIVSNPYPCARDWFIINILSGANPERNTYDTQKPKKLLEKIIMASSNENNLVADFFMGSGTTGEVALELDRTFIGCDISSRACEVTQQRIRSFQYKL